MGKEDMIRQILKGFEADIYSLSPAELERELKSEGTRLSEITYSEVEELYYKVNPSVSLLQV